MELGPVCFRDRRALRNILPNVHTLYEIAQGNKWLFTSQTTQCKIFTKIEGIFMPCLVLYFLTTHCVLIKEEINFSVGGGVCAMINVYLLLLK